LDDESVSPLVQQRPADVRRFPVVIVVIPIVIIPIVVVVILGSRQRGVAAYGADGDTVEGAYDEGRIGPLALREIDVGVELDTVTHGDGHVAALPTVDEGANIAGWSRGSGRRRVFAASADGPPRCEEEQGVKERTTSTRAGECRGVHGVSKGREMATQEICATMRRPSVDAA
jgi:hypothetical protein